MIKVEKEKRHQYATIPTKNLPLFSSVPFHFVFLKYNSILMVISCYTNSLFCFIFIDIFDGFLFVVLFDFCLFGFAIVFITGEKVTKYYFLSVLKRCLSLKMNNTKPVTWHN